MLIGRSDVLQVADSLAREKGIDYEDVITAIESAIRQASQQKYGAELDIRVHIERKSGHVTMQRYREVMAEDAVIENPAAQLYLAEARAIKADAEVGEFLTDILPPIEFGRNGAVAAKQVIIQRVREAERERHYEEFKDRVGEIVYGTVKRKEYGNVTLDINGAEALLHRNEMIPRENLNHNDRVRAYIFDVKKDVRGPQIFVSRSHNYFLVELFRQEVPEVFENIVEITAVARDPGSRAKIGVISNDSSIDPVGACVGMRGSRVQTVVSELRGERVDILHWKGDLGDFVVQAIAPAAVNRVVFDQQNNKIKLVVEEDQQSLAIGVRGQNVRLASQLVGEDIDIITVEAAEAAEAAEYEEQSQLFMQALDVEEVIARLLIAEDFASLEDLAFSPIEDLAHIEGFDHDLAAELIDRAQTYLQNQAAKVQARMDDFRIADDLRTFAYLNDEMILALGQHHIRTLEDFAELDTFELIDEKDGFFKHLSPRQDEMEAVILQARIALGWIEAPEEAVEESEAEEAPEPEVSDAYAAAEALFQDQSH